MPTRRLGKVRRWLKCGRAEWVKGTRDTIRLLDRECGYTQPLNAGIDLGTAHIGVSVISKHRELLVGEFKLRTDIGGLLTDRRMFRRARRGRKTRYRKPRFQNRHKPDGWLPPSVQARVDETLKVCTYIECRLPITRWNIEIGNFDPHLLANPDVEGIGYQNGPLAGYLNVREYVLHRDKHTCQACKDKSGDKVLEVHHIRGRKDRGSDRPDNLITLCLTCHKAHHNGRKTLDLKAPPNLRDATQFNVIKSKVMDATSHLNRYPTFGYITKYRRSELNLEKSHINDAFVIAGGRDQERAGIQVLGVFVRRQNRKLRKGVRSHIRNTIPGSKGFNRFDKVRMPTGRVGFIYGLRSSGYFNVRTLDGEVLSPSVGWKKLQCLEKARTLLIERKEMCHSFPY